MLHVNDSAGQDIFVSQLQTKVLALYMLMTARDAVPVPSNGFETQIQECLMLFFKAHGRQQYVSRNEDDWVTYRRAQELVPAILAKAATMRDDKSRYSPGVQAAFDDLKRYVWEVLSLKEVEDTKPADTDEKMQALLAAMKTLIQDYARA
jgi:hypothetical protein